MKSKSAHLANARDSGWNQTRAAEILEHRPRHPAPQAEEIRLVQAHRSSAMKLLQLLPIGNCDGRLLTELAPAMANLFRVPTEVLQGRLDPSSPITPNGSSITLRKFSRKCSATWALIRGVCWE